MKRFQFLLLCIALLVIATACSSGRAYELPTATSQAQHRSAATIGPMLYVANWSYVAGGSSILGFAANANGNVSPTVLIAGESTGLSSASSRIAVDKLGRIYVSGPYPNTITVWSAGSNGDAKPSGFFYNGCGNLGDSSIARFDGRGDLWVACGDEGPTWDLSEFAPIPPNAGGTMNVTKIRDIGGITYPSSVALAPNNQVSVVHGIVYTFNRTNRHDLPRSQLGGDKTFIDGGAISYDSHGRLVACSNRHHGPHLLTFARGAKGNVAPIRILSVAGCGGIAIDPQDNIYILAATSITEYAAGATGSAQPIRVISGNLTGLTNAGDIVFKT